jgi:hypothetical protein
MMMMVSAVKLVPRGKNPPEKYMKTPGTLVARIRGSTDES